MPRMGWVTKLRHTQQLTHTFISCTIAVSVVSILACALQRLTVHGRGCAMSCPAQMLIDFFYCVHICIGLDGMQELTSDVNIECPLWVSRSLVHAE